MSIEIKVHTCKMSTRDVATDAWVIDESSTMGRMIVGMLNKGHYGHRHFNTEVHLGHISINEGRIDRAIMDQMDLLLRQGKHPVKVLIGTRGVHELERLNHTAPGHWNERVSYRDPHSGERTIYGLPVTIVPWMEGILVCDGEMLEVTDTGRGL